MTGYEPVELRKMMKERLHLYTRKINTTGKSEETWSELLTDKEDRIIEYVNNSYIQIQTKWKEKALETIMRGRN